MGKTWLALYIGLSVAAGKTCGPWECTKPRRVLYIDGEMPLDGIKERVRTLCKGKYSRSMSFLSHERFLDKEGKILNFSDPQNQQAMLKTCIDQKVEIVVIDNLSCLLTGMAENDADSWEVVLPWLLQLRRHRISVIFIHHANRTGKNMRGTSRREDAAFWVIRLDEVSNSLFREGEGAQFITRFTKNRQGTEIETSPQDWRFEPDGNSTQITFKSVSSLDLFLQLIEDGLTSCTDIATEMGATKGTISKLAKKAKEKGLLVFEGSGRGTTYKLK